MKVVERIFEHRIRQQIEIDDMCACVRVLSPPLLFYSFENRPDPFPGRML